MLRAIGLMSGTSLDGVDAAWLETDGERIGAAGPVTTIPYDPELRRALRSILDRAAGLAQSDPDVARAASRLTEYHCKAVAALGQQADLIGFHGQTIFHAPQAGRTWQIGDASMLARCTGLPVAWDFRSADVAAGGEGAPLAPVFHAALARGLPRPLAVLNIGGVANVTFLGHNNEILAFDTGPGNGPIDDWMEQKTGSRYDQDGALARQGRANKAVLARLMAHPYFTKPPPKSLDRLSFGAVLRVSGVAALGATDGAATLVAFTVAAVARAPLPARPVRWLVCGGGRHNRAIMAGLEEALGAPVEPVEAAGWNGDALEAQCFGFLAARVLRGLPLSFPGTTGVRRPLAGGQIRACAPGTQSTLFSGSAAVAPAQIYRN